MNQTKIASKDNNQIHKMLVVLNLVVVFVGMFVLTAMSFDTGIASISGKQVIGVMGIIVLTELVVEIIAERGKQRWVTTLLWILHILPSLILLWGLVRSGWL